MQAFLGLCGGMLPWEIEASDVALREKNMRCSALVMSTYVITHPTISLGFKHFGIMIWTVSKSPGPGVIRLKTGGCPYSSRPAICFTSLILEP